jgi:hypothetical protein
MVHRPTMIKDQDRVEIRLTREAEYRLPFTFVEALNEGTLFDRPAHVSAMRRGSTGCFTS